MESKGLFGKGGLSVSHIPTVFLAVGYACFWAELYFVRQGRGVTSGLAYVLSVFIAAACLWAGRSVAGQRLRLFMAEYRALGTFERFLWGVAFFFEGLILAVTVAALLAPPHLAQEFDSLNYHLTLPRQHLIRGSFSHINWSSADLFVLPLQFGLAPYWLVTAAPSKIVQVVFVLGLWLVCLNLVRRFAWGGFLTYAVFTAAFFGSHAIGIQMPLLMLDLAIAYLFLAALDSFLAGSYALAALEFSFFFWSKPFMPLQAAAIGALLSVAVALLRFLNFDRKVYLTQGVSFRPVPAGGNRRFALFFLLFSAFIAGPFIVKSLRIAGTPLFPFAPGMVRPAAYKAGMFSWDSLVAASKDHLSTKDSYGAGRGILDFARHLWILAVPEKGVNNRFDYPVGLPYLLFLGPFLAAMAVTFKKKQIALIPLLVCAWWLVWWCGSRQARFLFAPLALLFIVAISMVRRPSKVLIACLVISLGFNFISVFRAHYRDFGKPASLVIREKDSRIMALNREYFKLGAVGAVPLDYYDAAFAQFPVCVERETLPWVLKVAND